MCYSFKNESQKISFSSVNWTVLNWTFFLALNTILGLS